MRIESFLVYCDWNDLCIYDGEDDYSKLFGPCCASPWSEGQLLTTSEENAYLQLTGNAMTSGHFVIRFDFKDVIGKSFKYLF